MRRRLLKAVSLISANFLKVIKNLNDLEARKALAMAQYMAGMSFTNVGLGISSFYGTSVKCIL